MINLYSYNIISAPKSEGVERMDPFLLHVQKYAL
jgi:hypothetical protein